MRRSRGPAGTGRLGTDRPAAAPSGADESGIVLACYELSAGYGDVRVLRDVTLPIQRGAIEVILGPNGAGKTTLASALLGLIPAASGRVEFAGTDITSLRPEERARLGIGLVQEGKRIFRMRTVEENLALGGRHLGRSQRQHGAERVYGLFPKLGDERRRRAGDLSGGQQQMLAIGQALMGEPTVLILDEPSAGLAPVIVDDVVDAVLSLKSSGLSIVVIEQLVDRALGMADHVTVLSGGQIALSGRPDEVGNAEMLVGAYFGTARRASW